MTLARQRPFCATLAAVGLLGLASPAQTQPGNTLPPPPAQPLHLMQLRVPTPDAGASALADLHCPSQRPAARPTPAASAPTEVLDVPDDEQVTSALQDATQAAARQRDAAALTTPAQDRLDGLLPRSGTTGPLRIAIWGDSHLAAGFLTEGLMRATGLPAERVTQGFLPAGIQRPGIRLPLKKSCLSPGWRHEPGYVSSHSGTPGPGLVNLMSNQPDAWFALDLRDTAGRAERSRLRLLYQQTAEPLQIGLSVDGAPERLVDLSGPAGPAALELLAAEPISQLRVRLVQGQLRWHGLAFAPPAGAEGAASSGNGGARANPAVLLDVFGYPGATANGWRQLDSAYMGAWFQTQRYDLVMLEYGTNEGNDRKFDPASYEQGLRQAVGQLTTLFPEAGCVLIAPGDRGVLVRRVAKKGRKAGKGGKASAPASARKPGKGGKVASAAAGGKAPGKGGGKPSGKAAARSANRSAAAPAVPASSGDLLRFARVHAEIGRVQHRVAESYGCKVWSMQTAMGGQGSAYQWVRQTPALMARDLLHYTAPGYWQLGRLLFDDLGWGRIDWLQPGLPLRQP